MTDQAAQSALMHRWYARPVLFAADLSRALRFYLADLGFKKDWHADEGKGMD